MINNLLQFTLFLEKFRDVERTLLAPRGGRNENDTEHSYMLAMLAWHICSVEKLTLNVDKVIRYALVHDLVEVYAGDECVYDRSEKDNLEKEVREQEAQEQIMKEWENFPEMVMALRSYREQKDPESLFVYALDKLQPMLVSYHGGGEAYRKLNVTLEMIVDKKKDKVNLDPTVQKYFDELVEIFKADHNRLFETNK